MADVVERYKGLADSFGERVEGTPDDKWSAEAPCEGWEARDVVLHVVEFQRKMTAALDDQEVDTLPVGTDPKEAWRAAYPALLDKLSDPANLQKAVPGPMGPMPAELIIGRLAATDVLVHTWDLARATGQDERLDQDAVQHAFDGLKPVEAMLRRPGLFGPAVDAPDGAELQTQFLCFLGRRA